MAEHPLVALSPEMALAQEQLRQRRRQRRQQRLEQQLPIQTDAHGRSLLEPCPADTPALRMGDNGSLGWQSEALTRALAAAHQRQAQATARAAAAGRQWLEQLAPTPSPSSSLTPSLPHSPTPTPPLSSTVPLHPDLALALLRQEQVGPARLWLLLRVLDPAGKGWVEVAEARRRLSSRASELHLCTWRHLRNQLEQGEGLFWHWERERSLDGRIWLRSVARVAAAVGLTHLRLHPVALPLSVLTEGIGAVRAHFYASFHSSRAAGAPIARETLRQLSRIGRRTQRLYEQRAGIDSRRNWAIGPTYNRREAQERAWQHGNAVFRFIDRAGTHGEKNAAYLAWQLPNSYQGPHEPLGRGRQKRVNQQLADLFMKGITGNGKPEEEGISSQNEAETEYQKCFYEHGRAAVKGYQRNVDRDAYWKSPTRGRSQLWHLLQRQESA